MQQLPQKCTNTSLLSFSIQIHGRKIMRSYPKKALDILWCNKKQWSAQVWAEPDILWEKVWLTLKHFKKSPRSNGMGSYISKAGLTLWLSRESLSGDSPYAAQSAKGNPFVLWSGRSVPGGCSWLAASDCSTKKIKPGLIVNDMIKSGLGTGQNILTLAENRPVAQELATLRAA